jgi:hypothetical protein
VIFVGCDRLLDGVLCVQEQGAHRGGPARSLLLGAEQLAQVMGAA